MKKTVLVLISVLIFFQINNCLYSANVLNPSFEDTPPLKYWTKEGTENKIIGVLDFVYDGSYSCCFIDPTSYYADRGISSYLVTVTANNNYSIYGWFLVMQQEGVITDTELRLRVVWLDGDQSEISKAPGTTGWSISYFEIWEKKEFSNLTAPSNAVYAKLLIDCKETTDNVNHVFVDYFFIDGDTTPPVTLSSFTVQYLNESPVLCWTTQSESNNAGWNIYRGENEEALSNEEAYQLNLSLGLIPGAGTTSEPTEYSFEDCFPIYQGNIYFYWLESVDFSGETELYGPISLSIPEYEWLNPNSPEIPKPYGLHQNYPNPFNPSTEISFMLNERCFGNLSIHNLKGQKIKTLFKNRPISRDKLVITTWDGKDKFGKNVSSGIYLYELKTNKEIYLKRMLLIK